ncbi:unnamed protein product [Prorocentrum cordatum]|uniref:Uncharacterized protein n=1 Tax=Prorocentrum cordatum TaxID=2364126 RepID=A0ABN9S0G5_9DINO|nr:unnamed protein product [Polarella glacialis]
MSTRWRLLPLLLTLFVMPHRRRADALHRRACQAVQGGRGPARVGQRQTLQLHVLLPHVAAPPAALRVITPLGTCRGNELPLVANFLQLIRGRPPDVAHGPEVRLHRREEADDAPAHDDPARAAAAEGRHLRDTNPFFCMCNPFMNPKSAARWVACLTSCKLFPLLTLALTLPSALMVFCIPDPFNDPKSADLLMACMTHFSAFSLLVLVTLLLTSLETAPLIVLCMKLPLLNPVVVLLVWLLLLYVPLYGCSRPPCPRRATSTSGRRPQAQSATRNAL